MSAVYLQPERSALLHRAMTLGYQACTHAKLAQTYSVPQRRQDANRDAVTQIVYVLDDLRVLLSAEPLPDAMALCDDAIAGAVASAGLRRYLRPEFAAVLDAALIELHRLACLVGHAKGLPQGEGRRAAYAKALDGMARHQPAMAGLVLTPGGVG